MGQSLRNEEVARNLHTPVAIMNRWKKSYDGGDSKRRRTGSRQTARSLTHWLIPPHDTPAKGSAKIVQQACANGAAFQALLTLQQAVTRDDGRASSVADLHLHWSPVRIASCDTHWLRKPSSIEHVFVSQQTYKKYRECRSRRNEIIKILA